jgi:P27 family predicted phage terminase small subunit
VAGRKRKPATHHELAGTAAKKPHIKDWVETDARYPALPMDIKAPQHLTPDQAEIWWRVMAAVPRGLLRRTDPDLVVRFCVLQDTFYKLNSEWAAGGCQTMVPGVRGFSVVHPNIIAMAKVSSSILRVEAELGFTPASRSRVDLTGSMKVVSHSQETAAADRGEEEFFND